MPGMDRTGPDGRGPGSGRGMGRCNKNNTAKSGRGQCGNRKGSGTGRGRCRTNGSGR